MRLGCTGRAMFTVFTLSTASASADASLSVAWTGARLAVVADAVPLADVLREVSSQTGIEITGLERITESCSMAFSDTSLAAGLRLLLSNVDYVIAWSEPTIAAAPPLRVWVRPRDRTVVPPDGVDASSIDAHTAVDDPELVRLEEDDFFEKAADTTLFAAASSASAAVRVRALSALSARNVAGSVEWLAAAMTDPDPWVSSVAGTLIAESSDPTASGSLLALLRDADPSRRWRALWLLEQRPNASSRPRVTELLDDEHAAIRAAAQRLLKLLDDLEAGSRGP